MKITEAGGSLVGVCSRVSYRKRPKSVLIQAYMFYILSLQKLILLYPPHNEKLSLLFISLRQTYTYSVSIISYKYYSQDCAYFFP